MLMIGNNKIGRMRYGYLKDKFPLVRLIPTPRDAHAARLGLVLLGEIISIENTFADENIPAWVVDL